MSSGSLLIFWQRPIAAFCILATVGFLAASLYGYYSRKPKGSLLGADL
jgi:hypothetical protein